MGNPRGQRGGERGLSLRLLAFPPLLAGILHASPFPSLASAKNIPQTGRGKEKVRFLRSGSIIPGSQRQKKAQPLSPGALSTSPVKPEADKPSAQTQKVVYPLPPKPTESERDKLPPSSPNAPSLRFHGVQLPLALSPRAELEEKVRRSR